MSLLQMEMDEEEKQLVQDANAQAAGEAGGPDAAPPVPQEEEEDIMVRAKALPLA